MEPQTQIPQIPGTNAGPQIQPPAASPAAAPSPQPKIDPTALALSRSIRQVESNGNYNAVGDNGKSHGAYQFNGDNFQQWAKQYGLDPSDTSETNQDHVAYSRIKEMLDEGTPPSQVAARWNGATYSNGQYQAINPAYVDKVKRAYQQQASRANGLGALTPKPSQEGVSPSLGSGQVAVQQPKEGFLDHLASGNILGVAKDVTNFAFPIVGDIYHDIQGKPDKSILQQAGDLGLSALWFLPFGDIAEGLGAGVKGVTALGEAGAAADAVKAGEAIAMGGKTALGADIATPAITGIGKIGSKIAPAAGGIGAGLVGGYAGDISSNLSQGKTDASVLKPGLGTALGGGIAGAGLGASSLYKKFLGEQEVVSRVQQAYEDAFGATKTGIQKGSSIEARSGTSPGEFLANAGIPPETQEINGRRVFTTGPDSGTYQAIQQRAEALTNLRDMAIAKSGATNNFNDLRIRMLAKAEQDFSGSSLEAARSQINKEMDALARDPKYRVGADGNMSAADTTKMKSYLGQQAKFDTATPSNVRDTFRTMSGVAKDAVEETAQKSDVPSIKTMNRLIQQHLDFLDTNGKKGLLSRLNGQTLKGGRLGKYVYETIGGLAGEGASNALGGGLVGNIAGPILGSIAGSKVSQFMQKLAAGGPFSAATLGRMATEDPEIVQQFLEYIGSKGGERIAPTVRPLQQTAGGLLSGFAKKKSPAGLIRL